MFLDLLDEVANVFWSFLPGKPYWKGRLSTVDLLALTSLDQLILKLKYYLPLLQNKLP